MPPSWDWVEIGIWKCPFKKNQNANARFTIFFYRNRDFQKFWAKSRSFKISKNIEIFRKFGPNLRFFKNVVIRQDFWKFWLKSWFSNFFYKNQNFLYLDQNWDIRKFWPKSMGFLSLNQKINSFENLNKHRDFSKKKIPKSIFFREFRTDLTYFINFRKIVIFRQDWP